MLSQYQIINKILDTGDLSIVSLNNLTSKHFFNYKAEFDFIMNHYEAYKKVPDKITFINHFQDFELQEVNEPDSYLIAEVLKDYNTKYLGTVFNNIKVKLEQGALEEAEKVFLDSVDGYHTANSSMTCTSIIEDTSRYDRYIERASNRDKYYISTGFFELDQLIGGIDVVEENMVIAARTGIGKSWVLITMAAAAFRAGLNVGFYSGEMSTDKVAYRFDAILGNVNSIKFSSTDITRGNLYSDKNYKSYIESLRNTQHKGDFKVLTPNDINGPATVDALATFIDKYKLDILFIDQYSLLEDTHYAKNEHEHIAHISKDVKNKLQVMKRIPIISVTQNNRTGDKNEDGEIEQDTTQIAGSDRIPQDATTIIMLSRGTTDDGNQQLKINVLKARDGGDNRRLVYDADFDHGRFNFVSEGMSKEAAKAEKDKYIQSNDGGMF